MAAMLSTILSGTVWTCLLSYLLNYAVTQKTKTDTVKQRLAATLATVFAAILIYAGCGGQPPEGMLVYGVGGLFTYFVFVRKGAPGPGAAKLCRKCLEKNSPEAAFCENCGAALKSEDRPKPPSDELLAKKDATDRVLACQVCGEYTSFRARACPRCGNAMPVPDSEPVKTPRHYWPPPI